MRVDDVQLLQELRAEVSEPTPARLSLIQNRWTMAAESGTDERPRGIAARIGIGSWSPRRPGLGWRLAATGGLAATLGVAVLVAQGSTVSPPPPEAKAPAVTTVSAPQFLLAAANKAESRQAGQPRPDQWIYTKGLSTKREGKPVEAGQRVREGWLKMDGSQSGYIQPSGQLWVGSTSPEGPDDHDRSPAERLRDLQSLPTDPKALLERISQRTSGLSGLGPDYEAVEEIFALLGSPEVLLAPKVEAALFRALALVPDVRVDQDVVDAAGRHGVGVSRSAGVGQRIEIILAADSGAYLGGRMLVEDVDQFNSVAGYPFKATRKGEVVATSALLAHAIVDEAGQRP